MKRLPAAEFERLCQKPDHRRVGNWMARHVAQALRKKRIEILCMGISPVLGVGSSKCPAGSSRKWHTYWFLRDDHYDLSIHLDRTIGRQ